MIEEDAVKEIDKIPLPDNMIIRRIDDVASDIETELTEKLNKSGKFALQIDDSTDCSGHCHLLASVRYTDEEFIMENFFFCKEIQSRATGKKCLLSSIRT